MEDKKPELWHKYIETFKVAWKEARPHFDKANEDVRLFEQDPDLDSPTLSDISLAQAKLFVDQGLPAIMFRIFGEENPFELIPHDRRITYETARRVRDLLVFNMMTVMGLEVKGYLTIKDALKVGCGYGIIEPQVITPPVSEEQIAYVGTEEIRNREMDIGDAEIVPDYTYLPFGQVIPTPDGRNPEEASVVFVLRFFPEDVFRKMLDKEINPQTPFTGNAKEIIKYARQTGFDGFLRSPRQIAAQIAGETRATTDRMNIPTDKDTPVSVPVLCCYAKNEHVWFACDKFQVYHKTARYQTLRCPVVKATFDPDGNNWFTPGIVRPRSSMIQGVEMFYNALMDLLTMHLHPHQVVNQDALVQKGEAPDLQPYGRTFTTGMYKTTEALSWATPPPIPPALSQMGEKLEDFNATSAGQPRQLFGQGTPGLVRGGSGAMESLLQSSTGREKLQANHLEKGWYAAVVEQTLILTQMLAREAEYLPRIAHNAENNENELAHTEITRDDIRRVYRIELTFKDKMANQLAELQRNSMIYDRAIQNRFVNPKEAFALLVSNTRQFKQLTEGVDEQANLEAMMAQRGGVPRGTIGEGAPPEMTIPGGAGTAMGGLGI